jgi:hypothetical protein
METRERDAGEGNQEPGSAFAAALNMMHKTVRSRSDKSIGDTLESSWIIVAKRVIAEPTPRTRYEAPRMGIYDYDVVPAGKAGPVDSTADARRKQPVVSFRRFS